uniref:Deoxyribonuclease TATDN1 n=1 Tax=Spodoptera frugiperda TaxID=7108 RepID=A0A2H1WJ97_SPOFR
MTSEETQISEELKGCYENLIVIDIGANLTNKKYGRDLDSVVQRAKDAGVQKIMVTGTSVRNSKEALRLTRLYPSTIYSTAGKSLLFYSLLCFILNLCKIIQILIGSIDIYYDLSHRLCVLLSISELFRIHI